MDSMATGWTDETHRLYLDSVEASFVKKLYNSEYGSNDLLGWLPRTQRHTNASESHAAKQSFDQFKVLRRGCWEKLEVDRVKNRDENESKSCSLAENTWIQHFRSHSTAKEPHTTPASQLGNNNVACPSVQLITRRHGRGETNTGQPPASSLPYSQEIHKFSVGGITEFSDQNFVDAEVKRKGTGRRGKKRAISAVAPVTDQVVPFASNSNEKTPLLKENDEECTETNLEDTADSMQTEPHCSLFKD